MGEAKVVRFDVGSNVQYVPLPRLMSLQGNLKTLEPAEYQKLRAQILENGFSFAVHVWEEPESDPGKYPHIHILDGHQRVEALRRMEQEDGVTVGGSVPCVFVQAKDKAEAVRKCLGGASQFGTFHVEHLGELADIAGLEIPDLEKITAIPGLEDMKMAELVEEVNSGSENAEWVGNLPEFKVSEKLIKLTIVFGSLEDREKFVDEHKITVTNKMCGQWTSTL